MSPGKKKSGRSKKPPGEELPPSSESGLEPASSAPRSAGWVARSLFLIAVGGTALGTAIAAGVFWYFSRDLPKIISVEDYRPPVVTRVLGGNGQENQLLGEFYKNERRYLVPYDKIPDLVVKAFISAEDDSFFQHQGVNLASILRATIANLKAGHVVQGGSTITQQVAKSLLLTPDRNFVRKIKEVILSTRMERNLTKQQILYLYLNQIYLGRGAYGVQAAAKVYFRKDVTELTLAEAAVLAGLPQAPGKFSPNLNPKAAKNRQLYVLRRLYENKYITQSQMTEASAQPLKLFHEEELNSKYAGYVVEQVRRVLMEKYGEKQLLEEGLTVHVPVNRELAKVAQTSLQEGLRGIDKRIGYRGPAKVLTTTEEIEKQIRDDRNRLLERRLGFQLFMPDGTLSQEEAFLREGFPSEMALLVENEVYPAVVVSTDDKKKNATVMIGTIKALLPQEGLKWARPVKDEKPPPHLRGDPSVVSRVVTRGDVIEVRVTSVKDGQVTVSLEQTPAIQGALLALEAQTGNILAMEGGFSYKESEFNRVTQGQRQPGSAFKPVIYAAGLEKGYTPTSIIQDSPIVYEDAEFGKWKPNNFEEKFYGDTTFRQALIKSRNVPTIRIVQSVSVPGLIEYSRRIGMEGKFNADLSIALGSGSVSLWDLTRAYSLFPRMGKKVNPILISQVRDRDGKVLEAMEPQPPADLSRLPLPAPRPEASVTPAPSPAVAEESVGTAARAAQRREIQLPTYPSPEHPDQVMDPRIAYLMTHLMKEVVNYGTGYGAKSLGRAAAGKTGTTNDSMDAWFMGFTPTVVTGVWVGYDSQRPIGASETGAKAALPIWLQFMKEAVKPYADADFTVPPGIVFKSIDPTSGKATAANASTSIREAFLEGTEPAENAGEQGGTTTESPSEFLKEELE